MICISSLKLGGLDKHVNLNLLPEQVLLLLLSIFLHVLLICLFCTVLSAMNIVLLVLLALVVLVSLLLVLELHSSVSYFYLFIYFLQIHIFVQSWMKYTHPHSDTHKSPQSR